MYTTTAGYIELAKGLATHSLPAYIGGCCQTESKRVLGTEFGPSRAGNVQQGVPTGGSGSVRTEILYGTPSIVRCPLDRRQ